jgi:hypothetical protein
MELVASRRILSRLGSRNHLVAGEASHVAKGVVRDRRQGFGQLCFGRGKGRHGIGRKGIYALDRLRACQSDQRVDIVGSAISARAK